jgi:hypothetical protein
MLTSAVLGGEWSALRTVSFTPRENAPGTYWIRACVCPRTDLDRNNAVNFCCTFMFTVSTFRLSLWSSGQSSWLQIQRSGSDSRRYQIIWEVVGLERGPLSLGSTIEELLERKRSGYGLENREYDRREPSRWPHDTLYPQKLELTSPTNGGRSVSIVRSRTQATEFHFVSIFQNQHQLF